MYVRKSSTAAQTEGSPTKVQSKMLRQTPLLVLSQLIAGEHELQARSHFLHIFLYEVFRSEISLRVQSRVLNSSKIVLDTIFGKLDHDID